MAYLSEAYGAEITEARTRIYVEALEEFEPEVIRQAIHDTVKECRFFPTLAEIYERIPGQTAQDRKWDRTTKQCEQLAAKIQSEAEARAAEALGQEYPNWRKN